MSNENEMNLGLAAVISGIVASALFVLLAIEVSPIVAVVILVGAAIGFLVLSGRTSEPASTQATPVSNMFVGH